MAKSVLFTASPAVTGTATVPNDATFNAIGSFRVEMRVNSYTLPASYMNLWNSGGTNYQISINSAGQIAFVDWTDSHAGFGIVGGILSLSGITDFIVRATRNTATMRTHLELWNCATGAYTINTQVLDAAPAQNMSGTMAFGGTGATNSVASVGYVRWYNSAVALATVPGLAADGTLGDWEFEDNGDDEVAPDKDITFVGTATYATTPTHNPIAIAGTEEGGIRAGYSYTLDGTDSWSTSAALTTYLWQQTAGPNTATFGTPNASTTTVTGTIFGQYTFRLTVTDANALTANNSVNFGFVVSDDNAVVIPADPNVTFMFGELMRLGQSPWPHLDDMNVYMADLFGGLLTTNARTYDTWTTPLAGTITAEYGNTNIIGLNTTFQTDFGGGTSTPERLNDTYIVVWFDDGEGGFAKRPCLISSIPSQTSITLAAGYGAVLGITAPLTYSKVMYQADWLNGSTNNNYYDNVMAHYSLYYRSGLTKYLTYARTLADRWWKQPFIDQMNVERIGLNTGPITPFPRVTALGGIFWCAYESQSSWWTKLHLHLDFIKTRMESGTITDIREDAYEVAFTAIAAKLTTDAAKAAAYTTSLNTSVTSRWLPVQYTTAGAKWFGQTFYANVSGTCQVSASVNVVGTGTEFVSQALVGNPIWFSPDTVTYRVATVTDATHLTLTTSYTGTPRSGASWDSDNLVGLGTQPFLLGGVVGSAFNYVWLATGNATAKQFAIDCANYNSTRGQNSTGDGLYYGRETPNCEPTPSGQPECEWFSRFLQSETMGNFGDAYLLSGQTALYKTAGDLMMGKMIGWGYGGPSDDGSGAAEYKNEADILGESKCKNYGFLYGWGRGPSYLAARLGGQSPGAESPGPYYLMF